MVFRSLFCFCLQSQTIFQPLTFLFAPELAVLVQCLETFETGPGERARHGDQRSEIKVRVRLHLHLQAIGQEGVG